jgi:uncharacterized membrane protein
VTYNIIVAVFRNVKAASDAAEAINSLKDVSGAGFKLKSGIIVTKDDRGDVSVLASETHPFGGVKVSAAVGGLIGLIGGIPLAAVGALLGATVGAINAGGKAFIASKTVESAKEAMVPGTTAVIIDAQEASPNAVDDIVAKLGGRVFRQANKKWTSATGPTD